MRKPATNIRLGDGIKGLCDCVDQRVDCPRLSASHSRFDLRPTGLDGVEVWRIGRQGQEPCPARRDQRFDTCNCVRRAIIPEHDVAWLQRWTQDGTDPTAKDVPIDDPLDLVSCLDSSILVSGLDDTSKPRCGNAIQYMILLCYRAKTLLSDKRLILSLCQNFQYDND